MNFNRDVLEARAATLVGGSMQSASWETCRRAGWWLGLLLFKAMKKRRQVAIDNVRLAFPGQSEAAARQIARRSMQNGAMTMFEFVRLASATPQEISDYVIWDGIEHFSDALEKGRGALMMTAHLGNWEMMAAAVAQSFPITVVARPTSNKAIQEQILRVRGHNGLKVISKHNSSRATLDALKKNHVLGIVPDQYAGPDGMLLPFFGRPTRVVSSVARFSMMSGAPIVPTFGTRRRPWISDGRIVTRVSPGYVIENNRQRREEIVREGTLRTIDDLENIIRRYPDNWLWLHRRWRSEDF
jgi:KDO2-lipid IV(A) lauroyltransferase